eukprot:266073_1
MATDTSHYPVLKQLASYPQTAEHVLAAISVMTQSSLQPEREMAMVALKYLIPPLSSTLDLNSNTAIIAIKEALCQRLPFKSCGRRNRNRE